jgi:lipopolysaccharide heptosyltransferase II
VGSHPTLRVLARGAARRISYGVIGVLSPILRTPREPVLSESIRRILICRLDLMGDLVFTRPLILAMRDRYPGAAITLLTLPYTAPLAASYPEIDHIVTVDTNRIRTLRGLLDLGTWKQYLGAGWLLRQQHFDLGISVCGRMASLCVCLAGPRWSVGYADEAYPFVLDEIVPGGRYRERKHEVEYVRSLAHVAGAAEATDSLNVIVSADAASSLARLLNTLGVRDDDLLIVIHAGAVNGSAKRWPPRYWAQFTERIVRQTGAKVLLAGASSDEPVAREVVSSTRTSMLSLVGRTSVPELVALIARADLVATGDSGPLHLAVALGRPLVAVYGPTDPHVHGPFNPTGPVRIHRADIPCSPCYTMAASAECPLGDPICMRLVTVDEVVASAVELLQRNGDALSVREYQFLMS